MTTSWLDGGADMTQAESLMLAVCFGAMTGVFIGNFILLIKMVVDYLKEKKHKGPANPDDLN